MNYANIKCPDIANGLGCRITLFVSGCEFHCPGCFNAEAWDFTAGKPYTGETENYILNLLKPEYIQGLSVLGGEPLNPRNIESVLNLISHVKNTMPEKDIWVYTGYTWEPLMHIIKSESLFGETLAKLIPMIDILVDGLFIENKKDISLAFRGSSNQRIIKAKESIAQKDIALLSI